MLKTEKLGNGTKSDALSAEVVDRDGSEFYENLLYQNNQNN